MYPPDQIIGVRDGGAGLASSSASLPLVIGYGSGFTANTLYIFGDSNTLKDTGGSGPAVDMAAPMAGRGGVMVLALAATTAGSAGAVTAARKSTSTGTITVAGIPTNSWKPRIQITGTGTVGTGKFRYALDGYSNTAAYTWSGEYTIPTGGTFAVPNTTLTLTFVPGAGPIYFEAGDAHRFDCTAPHYTTTDLSAGITALLLQLAEMGTRRIRRVFAAGIGAAAGQVTLLSALAGHLDTLALNWHFARAAMDGGSTDTSGTFLTAIAAFVDDRICVTYGKASIVNEAPIPCFGVPEYPIVNAVAERAAFSDLSENLGRFLSGALRGVVRISHNEGKLKFFSEGDRITTLRTYDGEAGFYITNGYIRSSQSSDFKYFDWGLVIDEICTVVHDALQKWTLEDLDAKVDGTGQLSPEDAGRV